MADAVTALIGAIIFIGYIVLIAAKLSALPLWISALVGIVLMLVAFWRDDWKPVLQRDRQ